VIEYVVEENGVEQVYRLITDLVDVALFPALLLAAVRNEPLSELANSRNFRQ
jgi:hypothetical protein